MRTILEILVVIGLIWGQYDIQKQRDQFEANEVAVSQAYSKHLYVEYAKSECGLDVVAREDNSPKREDTFCLLAAKYKARWQIEDELKKK